MGKTKIKVGTIKGKDIFSRRENKPNRSDDIVKTGTGEHVPKQFKKKSKQKDKNELKELYK